MVPIASWDQLRLTGLKVSPGEVLKVFGMRRWMNIGSHHMPFLHPLNQAPQVTKSDKMPTRK